MSDRIAALLAALDAQVQGEPLTNDEARQLVAALVARATTVALGSVADAGILAQVSGALYDMLADLRTEILGSTHAARGDGLRPDQP